MENKHKLVSFKNKQSYYGYEENVYKKIWKLIDCLLFLPVNINIFSHINPVNLKMFSPMH